MRYVACRVRESQLTAISAHPADNPGYKTHRQFVQVLSTSHVRRRCKTGRFTSLFSSVGVTDGAGSGYN
ncbi:hypothetical protein RRG08_043756 [Elysia crispata]|uniref:Uncharacterized protein n=1 Tax=Elysia crispata TaxID=231223 RepID=A0AAE0ZPD3_9GAST|nr:hypothetical protein RRG08_043756 [Elysia crispata]